MIENVLDAEHLVLKRTRLRSTGTSRSPADPPLLGPCPSFRGMGGTGRCEMTRALRWALCFENIYILFFFFPRLFVRVYSSTGSTMKLPVVACLTGQ